MKKNLRFKLAFMIMAIQCASCMIVFSFLLLLYMMHLPHIMILAGSPMILPLVSLVASFILSAIIAVPVTKYILEPIKKLNDAMVQVSKGNFDTRVEVPIGRNEFSEMFDRFNKMSEELGSTELLKKDFINNFSHEFKTPIVSVRGFAKQLQVDDTLTDAQRAEYIDFIVKEADRLSALSNNILLLTKLENQQYVTEQSTFCLDEQLRHALLLLERQWMEKKLDLQIEMEEIYYTTDENMLFQVWVNLLSNAIKFSREGDVLRVEMTRGKKEIRVNITDTGEGIGKEEISKIFDKFYQADRSHVTSGNGLGLSLVKRICELLHCRVTVRSEKGKGSTFSVFLPVKTD